MREMIEIFRASRLLWMTIVAIVVTFLAVKAEGDDLPTTATNTLPFSSRAGSKAELRIDAKPIGPNQRVDDRRLSDERYLKYERVTFRKERKLQLRTVTDEQRRQEAERSRLQTEAQALRERERAQKTKRWILP